MCQLDAGSLGFLKLNDSKKFKHNRIGSWTNKKKVLACSTKICTMLTSNNTQPVKLNSNKKLDPKQKNIQVFNVDAYKGSEKLEMKILPHGK